MSRTAVDPHEEHARQRSPQAPHTPASSSVEQSAMQEKEANALGSASCAGWQCLCRHHGRSGSGSALQVSGPLDPEAHRRNMREVCPRAPLRSSTPLAPGMLADHAAHLLQRRARWDRSWLRAAPLQGGQVESIPWDGRKAFRAQ